MANTSGKDKERGGAERTATKKAGHDAPAGPADAAHRITAQNLTAEDRRFLEEHGDALGRTTLRARWLHRPEEHAERPGQSLATRSHAVIQRWAEERQAKPATVPGTEHEGHPGVLRFDFPGYGGRALQEIAWDDWFAAFDARHLVFVFQEQQRDGTQSNFFILDNPERDDG